MKVAVSGSGCLSAQLRCVLPLCCPPPPPPAVDQCLPMCLQSTPCFGECPSTISTEFDYLPEASAGGSCIGGGAKWVANATFGPTRMPGTSPASRCGPVRDVARLALVALPCVVAWLLRVASQLCGCVRCVVVFTATVEYCFVGATPSSTRFIMAPFNQQLETVYSDYSPTAPPASMFVIPALCTCPL